MPKEEFVEKDVQRHFDSLAEGYDALKEKNSYYYETLKKLLAENIAHGRSVLEVGCATGELLNALAPSRGAGIDLSEAMIRRARAKFPRLDFAAVSFEAYAPAASFDFITVVDVIEHVPEPEKLFAKLREWASPSTRVILTMANPLWNPVLAILEHFKLKMDEGPHFRVTEKNMLALAAAKGLLLERKQAALLFPLRVPFFSRFINDGIGRLRLFQKACLVQCYVFKPA